MASLQDALHDSEIEALKIEENEETAATGACRSQKWSNVKISRMKKFLIGGASIFTFVSIALFIILAAMFFPGHVDPRLFLPTRICRGDGFSNLYYNHTLSSGKVTQRFLKYKYIEDMKNDQLFNFTEARQKCFELNSTLWEILDGSEEWEAVSQMAKDKDLTDIWINAQVWGTCPYGQEICMEAEAERGQGVAVRYPSSRHAKFSRLYKVPDKSFSSCIYVDKWTEELLWATGNCSGHDVWGLCVKRDCFHEF